MNNNRLLDLKFIAESGLLRDRTAYAIYSYVLLTADAETGVLPLEKKWMAAYLNIPASTFYSAIQRLIHKYHLIETSIKQRSVEIRLVSQSKLTTEINPSNNDETITEQQRDDDTPSPSSPSSSPLNNPPNISPIIPSYVIAASQRLPARKKTNVYQRKPLEEATPVQRAVYCLEDALHTRIVNWGKQAKAYQMLTRAGYTETQICKAIMYLAKRDEFYQDKGFDLMTLVNEMPRLQAKEKAAERRVAV